MTGAGPARDAALFLQLVLGLQQSAMISLGKLMNPITRSIEKNLDGLLGKAAGGQKKSSK